MTKEQAHLLRVKTIISKIKEILRDHDVDTDPWSDSLEEIDDLVAREPFIAERSATP